MNFEHFLTCGKWTTCTNNEDNCQLTIELGGTQWDLRRQWFVSRMTLTNHLVLTN